MVYSRVETVRRFVSVNLHCIVSNLTRISEMLMLPSPGKISADANLYTDQVDKLWDTKTLSRKSLIS